MKQKRPKRTKTIANDIHGLSEIELNLWRLRLIRQKDKIDKQLGAGPTLETTARLLVSQRRGIVETLEAYSWKG